MRDFNFDLAISKIALWSLFLRNIVAVSIVYSARRRAEGNGPGSERDTFRVTSEYYLRCYWQQQHGKIP